MRESIRAIRCDFLSPQGTQSERICDFAYWLFRLFSRHISRTQSFQENRPFFLARVVLKPLVLLIGRLVACSSRISVDRQAHRETDKPTTVTLAAHACRGVIIISRTTCGAAEHHQENGQTLETFFLREHKIGENKINEHFYNVPCNRGAQFCGCISGRERWDESPGDDAPGRPAPSG